MVLNLTPRTLPVLPRTGPFGPRTDVTTPQPILDLGPITNIQKSTNLSNLPVFRGEQLGSNTVNYLSNLLVNRIAPAGSP